ncbi:hypothetical protein D3C86_1656420 [compost metagenome]
MELQADTIKGKSDKSVFKDNKGWEFVVDGNIYRDYQSNEIAIEYEKVLNYLIAKDFVLNEDKSKQRTDKTGELIKICKSFTSKAVKSSKSKYLYSQL